MSSTSFVDAPEELRLALKLSTPLGGHIERGDIWSRLWVAGIRERLRRRAGEMDLVASEAFACALEHHGYASIGAHGRVCCGSDAKPVASGDEICAWRKLDGIVALVDDIVARRGFGLL